MSAIGQKSEVLRWLHDVCFSIYFGLLFAWVEELRPYAWLGQGRFLYFWHPHAVRLTPSDFLLFYLELILIPAAAMFVIVVLMRRFSVGWRLSRWAGFVVAFAAFPFVCLYRYQFWRDSRLVPAVLMFIAAICFLLWAYRKVKVSGWLSIVLLFLYYSLLAFFGGGAGLIFDPPAFGWGIWDYAWIVYPAFGFCYALVWTAYFQSREISHHGSTAASYKGAPFWIGLVLAVIVVVAVAFAMYSAHRARIAAEQFVQELAALQVGLSSGQEIEGMLREYAAYTESGDLKPQCEEGDCSAHFWFDNIWLTRLHLARRKTLHSILKVSNGRVSSIAVRSTCYGSNGGQYNAGVREGLAWDPSGRDGLARPFSVGGTDSSGRQTVLIDISPAASPEQRRWAYRFNFQFLDRFGACNDAHDMHPSEYRP